jgi:tetratricopeptide (TPR) repeat protein
VEQEKQMRKVPTVGVLILLVVATSVSAQQGPAALVIRIDGDVAIGHGADAAGPGAVGEQLFEGDVVAPAAGSRAILINRAGAQQVVTQRTTISASEGEGNADLFARAVATLAQAASTDASMGGRQGMIRPIPGASALVAPRNALAVSGGRPTFAWTSTPGQTYDLMLRKVEGGRPHMFEIGTDTAWTLPADAAELEAGATYAWTVFVGGRRGGRPLPQQEFRVISLIESVEMQDYLDEIAVFGLDPMAEGLFLTVVAYRDLGLFYDASNALEEVERQSSLSAELYMLKGEILAELGHEEAAREAFDRADELMR